MRALIVFVLLACVGCHHETVTSGGIVVYKAWMDKATNELRYQAAGDLECSPSQLEFTLAGKDGKVPTRVYAEGCGRSALYARLLRRHGPMGKRTDANSIWERVN